MLWQLRSSSLVIQTSLLSPRHATYRFLIIEEWCRLSMLTFIILYHKVQTLIKGVNRQLSPSIAQQKLKTILLQCFHF